MQEGEACSFTHPCAEGVRDGGDFPFHPFPSPAEQQVSHALLAGGELPGWDGAAEGLEYFFALLPHPFSSVPRWRRTGLTGQAVFAPGAPHFHGELLQRSERSRGGLGAV